MMGMLLAMDERKDEAKARLGLADLVSEGSVAPLPNRAQILPQVRYNPCSTRDDGLGGSRQEKLTEIVPVTGK